MQEEIKGLLSLAIKPALPVGWVAEKESWIIVTEEGRAPRLEKTRYFTFWNRQRDRDCEDSRIDITVMTPEMERIVTEYIQDVLELRRYSPGAADPSSLIGVWA